MDREPVTGANSLGEATSQIFMRDRRTERVETNSHTQRRPGLKCYATVYVSVCA